MRRVVAVCAVALLCLSAGGLIGPRGTSTVQAAPLPSGLPSHFGIGLAGPDDNTGMTGWMPNSGVPWDYSYDYLAGGVNTGQGWETWNSSAQYPLNYAKTAASHHYIPVFPYYELLPSNGTCGSCGEAQKDLSDLNNATLMASYLANFRLLMQRLGTGTYNGIPGFGKTAIVHIEPDLAGYAQQAVLNSSQCFGYCTAQGNNPSYLKAAVASSNDPDVQGLPNTFQGFNWALLHLRDLYAPNVLLATHASGWASGYDIGSDHSTTLNATSLGQQVGSFLAQSGISSVPAGSSTYDLVFTDPLDRDAGLYKYSYGDPNVWWDRTNTVFPNFKRWESYVSAINQATNRSIMAWQIPIGNQYFATENNSPGHWQDNRAEYFFGHISELAQAGIIGLLFGSGGDTGTQQFDAMNDGITNPASICTTDGIGNGSQICNNHTSTVSDDDGGYLRMQGQAYYASPYPLGGASGATPTVVPAGTASPTPTATSIPLPTNTSAVTPTKTATASPIATKTPIPATQVPTTASPTATAGTSATRAVYTNGVATGFYDGTFGYSSRKACDSILYVSPSCSYAIAYTAWGGLDFGVNSGTLSVTSYSKLLYKLQPNGYPLADFSALLTDGAGNPIQEITLSSSMATPLTGGWYQITIPLSQLDSAKVGITSIQLKNATSTTLNTVHYDDVTLS